MHLRDSNRGTITGLLRTISALTLGSPGQRTRVRIIRAFREAGAVSRSTAQRFRVASVEEAGVFRELLESEIIMPASRGRYYLNQEALDARLDYQLLDAWLGWRYRI